MRLDRLMNTFRVSAFVAGVSIVTYGASTANADNTTYINQAIAAAIANGSNTIVVEPGTFPCDGAINYTGVTVAGYGEFVSILKIADSATSLQSIAKADLTTNAEDSHQAASTYPVKAFLYTTPDATSPGRKTGCRLVNIGIDGNGANQADSGSYANIVVTNTSRALLENVNSYNARPGLTVTGNQRAYCLLLTDDEKTTVRGGYYYGSGYDNIALRGWSKGARFIDVWAGATSGANARAAFQPAYQCQDWSCVNCTFDNTNTDGILGTGVTIHSSQYGSFTNCFIASSRAPAVYLFGDNTTNPDDTNHDQINTYPSATLDEYSDCCTFTGCTIEGRAAYATITGDGKYVRGHKWLGGVIRHTTANSALCVQLDGSLSSGAFAAGLRRTEFIGVRFEQFSASNVMRATYCRGMLISGCEIIKIDASNNALQFQASVGVSIIGNFFHCASTSACNIAVSLDISGGNPCDSFLISGNRFTKLSSNWNYGVYVSNNGTPATRVRVQDNDFTNVGTAIAFSTGSAGTGWWVEGNIGCVTEAVGTCTVANGATTTGNVAHGLTAWRTLRPSDIILTPTNSLGSATKYYVSSIDATNFVVTVNADPGATTATFGWQARANTA